MPLAKRKSSPAEPIDDREASVDSLLSDLKSADPQVRRRAARALDAHPEAVDALCDALLAEEHESVREAIFTALIRLGTEAVAEGLLPLLHSENVSLRNGATEALKTMPNAVAARMDEIFAGPRDVRIFGVEILGALAHPDSPHLLIRVIEEDPELNVCLAAVDALVECGEVEAEAPLRRLLDRFPDEPFLEFSVRTALSRIGRAE